MNIKPSAAIRQNYNEIGDLCRATGEPVYLTKNGEGDLVVMDVESFELREKKLKLREMLLAVEQDRLNGHEGYTLDESYARLNAIIDQVEKENAGSESFELREKKMKLCDILLTLEAERLAGAKYYTIEEVDASIKAIFEQVREKLLAVEQDRLNGREGYTLEESHARLNAIIDEVAKEKATKE